MNSLTLRKEDEVQKCSLEKMTECQEMRRVLTELSIGWWCSRLPSSPDSQHLCHSQEENGEKEFNQEQSNKILIYPGPL